MLYQQPGSGVVFTMSTRLFQQNSNENIPMQYDSINKLVRTAEFFIFVDIADCFFKKNMFIRLSSTSSPDLLGL